ncbi:unnamed protein product, partial [Rotaria sp. Silwood2]
NSIKLNDPVAAFSVIRRVRGGSKHAENIPIKDKNVDQKLINEIQIDTLSEEEEKTQHAEPSTEEVRRASSQMKSSKASGNYEVTADLLKAEREPVIRWLYEIFVNVWKNEVMVQDWSLTILIRLYKEKNKYVIVIEEFHY